MFPPPFLLSLFLFFFYPLSGSFPSLRFSSPCLASSDSSTKKFRGRKIERELEMGSGREEGFSEDPPT
jgi:hypothetical protein